MRNLLAILMLCAAPAFAAISATTQWDVRTTGNDANGGGFDTSATGTDRSQQDTAFFAYTDIVIGATTTQATSAARPFGATDPGNIINVISGAGCTVQRAQIVSVAGTTATFDKALGTAASTCTGNLGGALLNYNTANTNATTQNIVHIKSGTYTLTAQNVVSVSQLKVIGYGVTHFDGGTKPIITTATNTVAIFNIQADYSKLENLALTTSAVTPYYGIWAGGAGSPAQLIVKDCTLSGFNTGINGDNGSSTWVFSQLILDGTDIASSTTDGIRNQGNTYIRNGSRLHGSTGSGLNHNAANTITIRDSSIDANGTGITTGGTATTETLFLENASISLNTGSGISGASSFSSINSIFWGNGGWAYTGGAGATFRGGSNNAFGSNTSGNFNAVSAYLATNDKTLTVSPFTSSTNFALNSTAGGGALLKSAGYVGSLGSTRDIGPVQSAGGGGGGVHNPGSIEIIP